MTTIGPTQRRLDAEQLRQFYSDDLTDTHVEHFRQFSAQFPLKGVIVDVGGGVGHFAKRVGPSARVIDMDPKSVETCIANGVEAMLGDALEPEAVGDEGIICFNLILHHLIGLNERETNALQKSALTAWRDKADFLFVNEYIYEGRFWHDFPGKIIFAITRNRILSIMASIAGKLHPHLRANTLGVGVRFRSDRSWRDLFAEIQCEVIAHASGRQDGEAIVRNIFFMKYSRRDSYLLRFKKPEQH